MEETTMPPRVSIGMPVYNGAKFIREALESLLEQTFTDFELIISDNASTDGTELICREYAARDKRIRYVRWPENRGALANFNFVLFESVGEYFMWNAYDDIRSLNYLELNCYFLDRNLEYVASTSPTRYEGRSFDQERMGDGALEGAKSARISNFFGYWHANGRFYSLFRSSILKKNIFLKHDFLGSDWAIVLGVISEGKTMRLNQGYLVLGRSGFSNSGKILKHYRKSSIHYVIPFIDLIKSVVLICSGCSFFVKIKIFKDLFKLNMQAVKASVFCQIKFKF